MLLQKTVKIVSPSAEIPAIATTAIRHASKPYSSRSWPSVRFARRWIASLTRSMVSTFRNGEQSCPSPCPPQVGLIQIGLAQVCPMKFNISQVGPVQVCSIQVGPNQDCPM